MFYKSAMVATLMIFSLIDGALAQDTPPAALAAPATPRFTIQRFAVEGASLIDARQIEASLAPFTGPLRDFADVQHALETMEALYKERGYNTVYISVPEQELDQGVVQLKVVEGRIRQIRVEGNQHYTAENIRASLPALQIGEAPFAGRLSENIQLANENPTKEIQVTLGIGDEEGEINAKVKVKDESPWRLSTSLDNTGTESTGKLRIGASIQHNNIADTDQSFSLSYTSSPDKPEGVGVDVYSLGYRIPLYRLGDSIDLLYAKSSVGVPAASPSLAGALGIVGKGDIISLRYNWLLPREGEYTSRFVFALDDRAMESSCTTASGARLTGVSGCEPYAVRPLSVTYNGRWQGIERSSSFNLGIATNVGASSAESYDLASGNRRAPTRFTIFRAGGSIAQEFSNGMQLRLSGQAQYADRPLVPTEQMGLAGSNAVRGFNERAVASDQGWLLQTELYSPELSGLLSIPGSLRALGFYDIAGGRTLGTVSGNSRSGVASAGVGLRYSHAKNISWRFDLANILQSHAASADSALIDNRWRGHFAFAYSF